MVRYLFVLMLCGLAARCAAACEYHYFKNGRVSTSVCYNDNRFGKACAYNRQGKLIYEKHIRKIAGHASVHFTWYPDGAVQKAEFSDAPDGGIQWYRSTTWFSQSGEVTAQNDDGWDNKPTLMAPREKPVVQQTAECAPIYTSEFWFVNQTNSNIYVHADRLGVTSDSHTTYLKPGDTARGGQLIQAAYFDSPDKYFTFTALSANTGKSVSVLRLREQQVEKSVRKYYYSIK